jgi:hypothetical protein
MDLQKFAAVVVTITVVVKYKITTYLLSEIHSLFSVVFEWLLKHRKAFSVRELSTTP